MVEVNKALPSLARSLDRSEKQAFYAVCRPGLWAIGQDGKPALVGSDLVVVFTFFAISAISFVWLLLVNNISGMVGSAVVGTLFGAAVIAVLIGLAGTMLLLVIDGIAKRVASMWGVYCRTVVVADKEAWEICKTVHGISRCESWQDRTVDSERFVRRLLWSTIERCEDLGKRRDVIRRARSHSTLDELTTVAVAEVEREEVALGQAAANLAAILAAAQRVDRIRQSQARKKEANRAREAEERKLRSELLGGSLAVGAEVSEDRADQSAGLALESETIATLLADTDRIING